MRVQVTVRIDAREVQRVEEDIAGTPAEREEQAHRLAKGVGRVVTENALAEAAAQVQHPRCCGRSMENKGRRPLSIQGLDGKLQVPRVRYRCSLCRRELYAADGQLKCGRHRVTRALAKRACQSCTAPISGSRTPTIRDSGG